jgi:hypothetical protein
LSRLRRLLLPRWWHVALAFVIGGVVAAIVMVKLAGPNGLGTTSAAGSRTYTLISNNSGVIPQGETRGVGAFCPSGTHVMGGGYAIAGATSGVFVLFAAPVAADPPRFLTDSYGVTVLNSAGGNNVSVTAYAVCAAS